jgi:hypothetical protein
MEKLLRASGYFCVYCWKVWLSCFIRKFWFARSDFVCSHFRVKFRFMPIFHLFSTFPQKIKLFNKKFKSLAVFWVGCLSYENSLKVSVDLRCGLRKKIFSWGLYLIKLDIWWFLCEFWAKTRHFCPFLIFLVIFIIFWWIRIILVYIVCYFGLSDSSEKRDLSAIPLCFTFFYLTSSGLQIY